MIYLVNTGRLGNQFFRYCFAKKIQKIRNDELVINFTHVYRSGFKNDLETLSITDYIENNDKNFLKNNFTVKQRFLIFCSRLLSKLIVNIKVLNELQLKIQPMLERNGIAFLNLGYYKYNFENYNGKNIYINGCFENSKYLDKDVARRFYVDNILDINDGFLQACQKKNSVCISIRRGDFLDKKFKVHNVCGEAYFKKAIKYVLECSDASLCVFSDDITWSKKFIASLGIEAKFEPEGLSLKEKIFYMTRCNHFIISNSSFSWMIQYLSFRNDKIVISPNKWLNVWDNPGLIEEDFVKIDVGKKA